MRPEPCSPSRTCPSIRGGDSCHAQRCHVIFPLPAMGSVMGPMPQPARVEPSGEKASP